MMVNNVLERSELKPLRGHCVVFLGKTLTVPLSTQVYKWVPANLMLRVTHAVMD